MDKSCIRTKIRVQHQVDEAKEWYDNGALSINALKTMAIVLNQRVTNKITQMSLNNHNIPWSKNVKYLGMHLNESLTFTIHIIETIRKETGVRGILYPVLNRRSPIMPYLPNSQFSKCTSGGSYLTLPPHGIPLFNVQIGQNRPPQNIWHSFLRL